MLFDKVKTALKTVLAAAAAAAVTAALGVDWGSVIQQIPIPDWARSLLVTLLVGLLPVVAAYLQRERNGYGLGVPTDPNRTP